MTMTVGVASLTLVSLYSCLFAQTLPVPTFEVASVKLHEGPMPRLGLTTSGSRLYCDAASIRLLVMSAYDLKNYQVAGTAPLLQDDNTRWDIAAKAVGDAVPTAGEFRQMLQSLLADRFSLVVHREKREVPVYALLVAKNGPKLKESAPDADPTHHFGAKGRNQTINMPKASMDDMVNALANAIYDRPVIDRTGLSSTYEVNLAFTPEGRGEPDPADVSIFAVLQNQLGLRLEPQRAMIEVLVVDRVERPSQN